ncbi:MAG: mannitol dehydrogenase family protein [Gammaproteobacteria bacterium]|nr:mannitol dehydrogenase family protein [Gammaproteobacteria bacterium]
MNRDSLRRLPPEVMGPDYPRDAVTAGIAHIGVGAFHRAHLAVYVERCLSDADQRDWGVLGISLLARDAGFAKDLKAQDRLYSLTELAADGGRVTRVIGAIVEYVYAPDDPARLIERLSDPAIRIVSLTITEGGYVPDPESVAHDLAHPAAPKTAFGFIVAALALRRATGVPPFAVMSCDNLRHNGEQARRACVAHATARSPELASWIADNVDFPNAMVDRITPAMSADRRTRLNTLNGLDDLVPVACEEFIQWVLEDRFRHGRPKWERHGVQMVADVAPYEEAKIRLLNGAHQMISYPAWLAGHRQVDAALADPLFRRYLKCFLEEDAGVWVNSLPGMDLSDYKRQVLERFSNPAISDEIERLCLDGGSKIPAFLKPTLNDCLRTGQDARRLAFLLACFDRCVRIGRDDENNRFPLREPNAMQWIQPMIDGGSPMTLLNTVELVGDEAAADARFVSQYLACVAQLGDRGVRETLRELDLLTVSRQAD